MRRALAILAMLASPLGAAVTGTVMNMSTGKPQAGATVTLYKVGQNGPESLESVKSGADGKFSINQTPQGGPYLLMGAYDGVTYNHMLPPGRPYTDVSLAVYNASKSKGDAKILRHLLVLQPNGSQIQVNENFTFRNEGKAAYNDPDNGTLRFYLPQEAGGKVKVSCTAPQGMAIDRLADKTGTPNVYKVDFPIKPGETEIELAYAMPMSDTGSFKGKVLQNDSKTHVVVPDGVKLTSDDVKMVGQEPTTQAILYEITNKDYSVQVQGTGNLNAGEEDQEGGEGLKQIRAKIYDRYYPVLGLAFLILILGFILLYRKQAPAAVVAAAAPPVAPQKGKRR